jgi:hypothetical protein
MAGALPLLASENSTLVLPLVEADNEDDRGTSITSLSTNDNVPKTVAQHHQKPFEQQQQKQDQQSQQLLLHTNATVVTNHSTSSEMNVGIRKKQDTNFSFAGNWSSEIIDSEHNNFSFSVRRPKGTHAEIASGFYQTTTNDRCGFDNNDNQKVCGGPVVVDAVHDSSRRRGGDDDPPPAGDDENDGVNERKKIVDRHDDGHHDVSTSTGSDLLSRDDQGITSEYATPVLGAVESSPADNSADAQNYEKNRTTEMLEFKKEVTIVSEDQKANVTGSTRIDGRGTGTDATTATAGFYQEKILEPDHRSTQQQQIRTIVEPEVKRVQVDYASKSAGAVVLEYSKNFQGTSNLLQKDRPLRRNDQIRCDWIVGRYTSQNGRFGELRTIFESHERF